jgi:hypothetical protein
MSTPVNNGQIPWWDIRNKVANQRKTKVVKSESWSSYWMDDDSYDYFYDKEKEKTKIKIDGVGGRSATTIDLAKASRLAAVRRAVGNFVRILTNDDEIVVVFNDGSDSYTDGKYVVISAESDPKKFDVLVGTSLHEGAHCVLSQALLDMLKTYEFDDMVTARFGQEHRESVHNIVNCLEDRRIDSEVYRRAPGYRPYYQSMYDHHWNAKEIAKAIIRTEQLRVPTVHSYMFRIINITNPAIKYMMDKYLPEFRKIYDTFGLNNILRFSNPDGTVKAEELIECAMDIYQIILDNKVDDEDQQQQNQSGQSDCGDPVDSCDSNGGGDADESQSGQPQMSDEDIEKAVAKEMGKNSLGKSDPNMDKIEQKMMDFLNGDTKKKKITKKMGDAVSTMEESDITVSSVEIDGTNYPYVRVPRLTASSEGLLPGVMFNSWRRNGNSESVKKGRRLGQIIVDRIKIRHDNNETKFSRRPVGKIDRRLIHSLGTDNENVFYSKITQDYKNSVIYLTIDCSSSMHGKKWEESVVLTTGLAYAATKINNFDIVVNLRYGLDSIWSINMFDSRREPFSHFERWMSKFEPENTTPESIVYDIEKDFIESLKTKDNNVYFITMTDGGANYAPAGLRYNTITSRYGFGSEVAQKHCRQMLKRFKEIGIECLSYYIGNSGVYYSEWEQKSFKASYGKDGVFVPMDNFSMISKSLNDLLTRSTLR